MVAVDVAVSFVSGAVASCVARAVADAVTIALACIVVGDVVVVFSGVVVAFVLFAVHVVVATVGVGVGVGVVVVLGGRCWCYSCLCRRDWS